MKVPVVRKAMSLLVTTMILAGPLTARAAADSCDSPRTQREMESCAAVKLSDATHRLEEAYTKYGRRLHEGGKELLEKSQDAWRQYAQASCAVVSYQSEGGSMQTLLVTSCRTKMMLDRVEVLRSMFEPD